ncbi:MAG: hypothetical protein IPG27_22560 [Ottowia sp.]|nr:hypothetical protein [Ottowia sp.]
MLHALTAVARQRWWTHRRQVDFYIGGAAASAMPLVKVGRSRARWR